MTKIRLVNDGVFPITRNISGLDFPTLPETGLGIAGTIQGEGKLAGIPVLFIRLAGCNLRCAWTLPNGRTSICDTPLSSFDTRKSTDFHIADIVETILINRGNMNHLVISGGEPFVQRNALLQLVEALKSAYPFHITVETNASIFDRDIAQHIDFFSLSPKLSSSIPTHRKLDLAELKIPIAGNFADLHQKRRMQIEVIEAFVNHVEENKPGKDFQLKFVFSGADDAKEIRKIQACLPGVKPEDILLMPLGTDMDELHQTEAICIRTCIENGWRYSPRYHIQLFGNKHGV